MALYVVGIFSVCFPSILGFIFIDSVLLFICSSSCVLYSTGSGVNNVHVSMIEYLLLLCVCRSVLILR